MSFCRYAPITCVVIPFVSAYFSFTRDREFETLWEQEWNSELGLSDSKGHFVLYHIECEVDSNGEVEGVTVMSDLRDWVDGESWIETESGKGQLWAESLKTTVEDLNKRG